MIAGYALRLARLHADAPSGSGGKLPARAIDALTSGNDVDSVYQLAVDLRAELVEGLDRANEVLQ